MAKKPTAEEFEISDAAICHRPTGVSFVPLPLRPTEGTWHDGNKALEEYDAGEVKEMIRQLLAKRLTKPGTSTFGSASKS